MLHELSELHSPPHGYSPAAMVPARVHHLVHVLSCKRPSLTGARCRIRRGARDTSTTWALSHLFAPCPYLPPYPVALVALVRWSIHPTIWGLGPNVALTSGGDGSAMSVHSKPTVSSSRPVCNSFSRVRRAGMGQREWLPPPTPSIIRIPPGARLIDTPIRMPAAPVPR